MPMFRGRGVTIRASSPQEAANIYNRRFLGRTGPPPKPGDLQERERRKRLVSLLAEDLAQLGENKGEAKRIATALCEAHPNELDPHHLVGAYFTAKHKADAKGGKPVSGTVQARTVTTTAPAAAEAGRKSKNSKRVASLIGHLQRQAEIARAAGYPDLADRWTQEAVEVSEEDGGVSEKTQ